MNSVDRLMDRLGAWELVVIDGATGTECERRGVPKLDGAWNGGAALSHPEVVRQIHRDYLDAGAELIIANTFATHRHALEVAGVADDFVAYNRRGVGSAIVCGGLVGRCWSSPSPIGSSVSAAHGPVGSWRWRVRASAGSTTVGFGWFASASRSSAQS